MQLNKKALVGGVALLATTASILATTISPAAADPTRPYAATGSDTTQDVWNGLTNDFGAPIPSVASYNAFDANAAADPAKSFINTKSGGANFLRPSGSGAGRISLSAVWDPGYASHLWPSASTGAPNAQVALTKEEVDFARSSGKPGTGTGLKAIPFARDAVAIAYKPTAGLTGLNLTTGEITSLFNGVDAPADQVTFSEQPATAATVVSVNGVAVHPKIPQNASGTRSFFLGAIGVTTAQLAPYIPGPNLSASAGGLPENDGTVLTTAGDLITFSAAQWISQANGKAANTITGLELSSVNALAPTSGTAPNMTPGALFGATNVSGDYNVIPGSGVGVFNRDTYNIVPDLFRTGTSKQQTLVSLLGSAAGVYGSNSKVVIKAYGFGTLSYGTTQANWIDGAWAH
jgi:hypothetical protein